MSLSPVKFSIIPYLLLGFLFVICSSSIIIIDNEDDYALDNYIRYDDYTYNDSIKTVLLYNTRNEMSYPIISLNGNEKIKLSNFRPFF